jgi:hypothetical protein
MVGFFICCTAGVLAASRHPREIADIHPTRPRAARRPRASRGARGLGFVAATTTVPAISAVGGVRIGGSATWACGRRARAARVSGIQSRREGAP